MIILAVAHVRRILSEGIDRTTISITSTGNAIRRNEKRNQRIDDDNPIYVISAQRPVVSPYFLIGERVIGCALQ
jgi:hypothetical protein